MTTFIVFKIFHIPVSVIVLEPILNAYNLQVKVSIINGLKILYSLVGT